MGLIPGLALWVKGSGIAASCGVGCRCGSDPVLLWLWCRPAAAALIQPLAWELPYAMGVTLKKKKRKKKKKTPTKQTSKHQLKRPLCQYENKTTTEY